MGRVLTMSKYTRSIMSIMQQNAGGNDITTIDGMYEVAKTALFPTDALNVISEQYQKQLIVGFTQHYFMDEIGLETLPLWKIAISEKLYNYGSYINLIYENLDKQVFADYRVTNSNKNSTNNIVGTNSNLVEGTTGNSSESNTVNNDTFTENIERDYNSTVTGSGNVTNAKSGSDVVSNTGTDMIERSGNDVTANTGTESVAHTGTQGVVDSSTQETNNTGTTKNDNNSINIVYDTPQGSLSNMRTPGGDASGRGVSYANGQTYNYMSGATEEDSTNVQTDDTTSSTEQNGESTTTFNDTNTTTRNLESTINYGSVDTNTKDLSTTTQYGLTDTQTRNTTDGTVTDDDTSRTGSSNKESTNTTTNSGTSSTNTTGSTNTEANASDEINATDYRLNWEMLYKSMPLLNKLWDIFDDLFMGIY